MIRTLLIDDIGISVTVKYYFDLLGKRHITMCHDNIRNRSIHLRKWQGSYSDLAEYIIASLDKVIKNRH